MSSISLAVVVLLGFVPPVELAARAYRGEIAPPAVFGVQLPVPVVLILAWLVLWILLWLPVRWLGLSAVDRWTGRLAECTRPRGALLPLPLVCLAVLLLMGVRGLLPGDVSRSAYPEVQPQLISLALLGLVAELGRLLEVAIRDERQWIEDNVGKETLQRAWWPERSQGGSSRRRGG